MGWTSAAAVARALGPSVPADDPYLADCVDAANAWAFRKRAEAGYVDDPMAGTATGLFTAMWQFSTNTMIADPGVRHYRNNTARTQLAMSITDDDSIDRHAALMGLIAGDRLAIRSTQTADAWGTFSLSAAPVDLITWVRLDGAVDAAGAAATPPGNNDRILFDFVRPAGSGAAPSGDVALGTTMYAAVLFRERGSADSFASFDELAAFVPTGTMGQILRLLGVGRGQTDKAPANGTAPAVMLRHPARGRVWVP